MFPQTLSLGSNMSYTHVSASDVGKYFIAAKPEMSKQLLFTEDSFYSSSKVSGSRFLISVIRKHIPSNNLIITDGTSNIGTDAINLATVYPKINAVEMSELTHYALQKNVEVIGVGNKVTPHLGSILDWLPKLEQDVVYLDAPWGGPDYKKQERLRLYLDDKELSDVYIEHKHRAKLFIFKVPFNYDMEWFKSQVKVPVTAHPFRIRRPWGTKVSYILIVLKGVKTG